ncbi:MAG: hypothetical protein KatS3mg124_1936 [Porticoccaceae bacterium]|nr:MAG: hypothetical protein KatS3mg124_1936 [Porticoccaceae bacterium]
MLSEEDKRLLLEVARASVEAGLTSGRPLPVRPQDFPDTLARPGACFVTLKLAGRLRGCIGSLEAHRPLVVDCAENAFAAAFRDPRFPPVSAAEFPHLEYHLSVIGPLEPLHFRDEGELLARLRPGVDGLVLAEGPRRATFLPAVWRELPDPAQFLAHLKQKAGLPPDYWSDRLRAWRYRVEEFP